VAVHSRDGITELTTAAVEQLAANGAREALGTLQSILVATDRPLDIRLAAGLAVGRLARSEEDRAWLLDALAHAGRGDDAAPLADAAVLALGPEDASQVLALAADPGRDPGVRAAILGAFTLSPTQTPGLQAALAQALQDSSPELRKTAVALLTGEAAVAPLLGALAGDADADVRAEAALTLGGLGHASASALPALQRALELEPDAAVRKTLRQSIGRISRERIASKAIAEASSPAANAIGER
jgi:HEAT repeat protein